MSTRRKEIGRELLHPLRGVNDAEGDDDVRSGNGDSTRRAPRSRTRSRPQTPARGAGGNGASVFQDIRARARDAMRGLRDGGAAPGNGLSALRERTGGADGD